MKENHTEDSDQNVKSHEERKYQFIKEQIRPQGREKMRKIVRRIALFCGILILFAVISMSSFYIMRKYMPVEALDTEIIYVTPAPSDQEPDSTEETEAAARETDPAQKSNRSQLSSLEQYDHLTQQLIDNGNAAKSSLVQLRKDSEQMLSTDSKHICGVLFQKSKRYLYILTSYNTSQEHLKMVATFADGSEAAVELAGCDTGINMAVYRVKQSDLSRDTRNKLKIITRKVVRENALGSRILAVGQPNGVMYSVNSGIITNNQLSVSVPDSSLALCTMNIPYCKDGAGFVLNTKGEMIGVLTKNYTDITGTSESAFIAIESLQGYIRTMIQGHTDAYLGVMGSAVDTAEAKKLNLAQGVYVDDVNAVSPAFKGGMRTADVILRIGDNDVSTPAAIKETLRNYQSGDTVKVVVSRKASRGRNKISLKVTLG